MNGFGFVLTLPFIVAGVVVAVCGAYFILGSAIIKIWELFDKKELR